MSDTTKACGLCGTIQNVRACTKCRVVYYCCKQHQVAHWKQHKPYCKTVENSHSPQQAHVPPADVLNANTGNSSVAHPPVSATQPQDDAVNDLEDLLESLLDETPSYDLKHPVGLDIQFINSQLNATPTDQSMTPAEEFDLTDSSAASYEARPELPHPQTFLPHSPQVPDHALITGPAPATAFPAAAAASAPTAAPAPPPDPAMPAQLSAPMEQTSSRTFRNKDCSLQPNVTHQQQLKEKETKLADYVVQCLNNYGLCVVDNFMGQEKCGHILAEAQELDMSGLMTEGQLTSPKNVEIATKIREDKIAWIEKGEMGYGNIGHLIGRLDSLIMQCNGRLERYDINGRTKAMVACYPGHGTSYLRHVDNPNADGRCITCIYYLNKEWNVKDHGGLLRIYPAKFHNKVADVEPIFDRVIFFWSDYRNPHEVRPSLRTRYAITVWYFDATERAKAKLLYTKQGKQHASHSHKQRT